jgi:hypothetical protein
MVNHHLPSVNKINITIKVIGSYYCAGEMLRKTNGYGDKALAPDKINGSQKGIIFENLIAKHSLLYANNPKL